MCDMWLASTQFTSVAAGLKRRVSEQVRAVNRCAK